MNAPQTDVVESEFAGTFEQFKQLASDFLKRLKAAPAPTGAQVESGLHGLRLAWVYLNGTELDRSQAFTLMTIVDRTADAYLRNL